MPASLVLSSQFTGYDGREMDLNSNESVELTFPIKVEQAGVVFIELYHCLLLFRHINAQPEITVMIM